MEAVRERPKEKKKKKPQSQFYTDVQNEPINFQKLVEQVDALEVFSDNLVEVKQPLTCSSKDVEESISNERREPDAQPTVDQPEPTVQPISSEATSEAELVATSLTVECDNLYEMPVDNERQKDLIGSDIKTTEIVENAKETSKNVMICEKNIDSIYPELNSEKVAQASAPAILVQPMADAQLKSFYHNAELEQVDSIIEEFLQTTLRPVTDEFFVLVQSYLDSCRRIEQLLLDAQDLQQRWEAAKRNVWVIQNQVQRQQGTCGENRTAYGNCTVQLAKFQNNSFEELKNLSRQRRHVRVFQLTLAEHDCRTAEIQCQHYVTVCLQEFRAAAGINEASPDFVRFDGVPAQLTNPRSSILRCIDVIFYFLRQPIAEQKFANSCRGWLNDLCCCLLRCSFPSDHITLLCHLLRCPTGVSQWASCYVQPISRLDSSESDKALNHFLALLNVCLRSIREREEYLKNFACPETTRTWTMVDSDGEELQELLSASESDLLALLNQFSFDHLFCSWFQQMQQSGITELKILNMFAFELTFLKIIFDGLRVYNSLQYKQLCKQLGYVMRQSVQYVSEFWLYFRGFTPPESAVRLQLEHDRLVFRAIFYGVCSKGLGVWQFLVDMPYADVSVEYQWRIFNLLFCSDCHSSPSDLLDKTLDAVKDELRDLQILSHRLLDLEDTDATYLLTTLGSLACTCHDSNLVIRLTDLLCKVCFELKPSRDTQHKTGRELLKSIVERHPWVFSHLLDLTFASLDAFGVYAVELFDHLPIGIWQVDDRCLSMLRKWLFLPLSSLGNCLCQKILIRCNWSYISGALFLPAWIHRAVAFDILKAAELLCPAQNGLLNNSFKKASKVASSMTGQITAEQQFFEFCWFLLLRLKLHRFDLGDEACGNNTEENRPESLIAQSKNGNIFASYVAFMCLVKDYDSFFDHGLLLLQRLVDGYCFKPAIVCVSYALRLLITQEPFENTEWLKTISSIIHADDTYYQLAKVLITGPLFGENLVFFGSMLTDITIYLVSSNQTAASNLIGYTLRLCCKATGPSWNTDRSCLYLVDRLIQLGFLCDPTFTEVTDILASQYRIVLDDFQKRNSKTLFSRFRGEYPLPPLVSVQHFAELPWLAFVAIKAEEIAFSKFQDVLFSELIRNPNQSLDAAFKKASSQCGNVLTVERSVLHNYAELASSLSCDHTLVPLVLQRLGICIYQQVRISETRTDGRCVGGKFLEHSAVSPKITALKASLQSAIVSQTCDASRMELLKAFISWLSDERLLASGTSNVFPHLFEQIRRADYTPWLHFVDFNSARSVLDKDVELWQRIRQIAIKVDKQPKAVGPQSPLGRLYDRIRNLCNPPVPVPPIIVRDPAVLVPEMNVMRTPGHLLALITPLIDNFYAASRDFGAMQKSVIALDDVFFEQLRSLYITVDTKVVVPLKCSKGCQSPIQQQVTVKSSMLCQSVENSLEQNRSSWSNTIDYITNLLSHNIPQNCACLYAICRLLARRYCETVSDKQLNKELYETGTALFYKLVSVYDNDLMEFPPSKALFGACCDALSIFIVGFVEQMEPLFNLIFNRPSLFSLLIRYYDTTEIPNLGICRIYKKLCESTSNEEFPAEVLTELLKKMQFSLFLIRMTNAETNEFLRLANEGYVSAHVKNRSSVLNEFRSHWKSLMIAGFPSSLRVGYESIFKACECGTAPTSLLEDAGDCLGVVDASGERLLRPVSVEEVTTFFGEYFHDRRLKCKECSSYGLFHCWDKYSAQICRSMASIFACSIRNPDSYQSYSDGFRNSVKSLMWLFSAWLEPLSIGNQACTPWSLDVSASGECFMSAFVDSLLYLQKLYAEKIEEKTLSICSLALEWYSSKICIVGNFLGNFILRTYHTNLLRLPWRDYWPSLPALDILRQIVNSKSQSCCTFATNIVVRLQWTAFFNNLVAISTAARAPFSGLALTILICCSSKEANYVDCKASLPQLFNAIAGLDWSYVEWTTIEENCQFIIRNFEPACVISKDTSVGNCALTFLSRICYFDGSSAYNWVGCVKRQVSYIRLVVNLLVRCGRLADVSASSVAECFVNLVGRIDAVVQAEKNVDDRKVIAASLLPEAVKFWNQSDVNVFNLSLENLLSWLTEHSSCTLVLPIAQAYGEMAADLNSWLLVADKCIQATVDRANETECWNEIINGIRFKEIWRNAIKTECQSKDLFFVLYVFWRNRLCGGEDLSLEATVLQELQATMKQIVDRVVAENALVMLTGLGIALLTRQALFNDSNNQPSSMISEFVSCLQNAIEGKASVLSSLRLAKKTAYSTKFQLMASILRQFILQQKMDDSGRVRLSASAPLVNWRVDQLKNLANQKQFSPFSDVLETAVIFASDRDANFADCLGLYSNLAHALYNKRYLIDAGSL